MADNDISPFWYPDSCATPNCEHYIEWLNSHKKELLSTSHPQEIVMDNIEVVSIDPPLTVDQVPSEAKETNAKGRPCGYCQRKDEIDRITKEYIDSGRKDDKPRMLFINELAMKLGVYRDIVTDWKNKKTPDGELEHPDFNRTIKELESIQEFRLQQRLLGRYNPTGSIFLLKTKHGYMETSKQVLAGDKNEPLQIEIIEEGKQIDAE